MPDNLRDRWENRAYLACWAVILTYGTRLSNFPYWQQIDTLVLMGILAQVYFYLRLRSNAMLITEQQYPDLHASIQRCRARFGNPDIRAYAVHTDEFWLFKGGPGAYGTFYLSNTTIEKARSLGDPRALDYFIGREMGSTLLGHGSLLRGHISRIALIIPPIEIWHRRCMGRSRDRAGIWACQSVAVAERCLAVMAAGQLLGREMDLTEAKRQWADAKGHWMTRLATLVAFTPHATQRIADAGAQGHEMGIGM